MSRGFQYNFSDSSQAMFDQESRLRKARTVQTVLEDFLKHPLTNSSILVAGGSTGIIDSYLSEISSHVVSLDIDAKAIHYAAQNFLKPNLDFIVGDATNIAFPANQFDVVICSQVYEHVPNSNKLLSEIHRVLKPGGICYFAAGNRLNIMEPHYRIPFLSVMPKSWAHHYLRLMGRGNHYYETHLSYWGLRRLTQNFNVVDYSYRIVSNPKHFETEYMIPVGSLKQKVAIFLSKYFIWLFPGYVWVLQKPNSENRSQYTHP